MTHGSSYDDNRRVTGWIENGYFDLMAIQRTKYSVFFDAKFEPAPVVPIVYVSVVDSIAYVNPLIELMESTANVDNPISSPDDGEPPLIVPNDTFAFCVTPLAPAKSFNERVSPELNVGIIMFSLYIINIK